MNAPDTHQAAIITAIEVTPAECRFGPNCPLCGQESEEA